MDPDNWDFSGVVTTMRDLVASNFFSDEYSDQIMPVISSLKELQRQERELREEAERANNEAVNFTRFHARLEHLGILIWRGNGDKDTGRLNYDAPGTSPGFSSYIEVRLNAANKQEPAVSISCHYYGPGYSHLDRAEMRPELRFIVPYSKFETLERSWFDEALDTTHRRGKQMYFLLESAALINTSHQQQFKL